MAPSSMACMYGIRWIFLLCKGHEILTRLVSPDFPLRVFSFDVFAVLKKSPDFAHYPYRY